MRLKSLKKSQGLVKVPQKDMVYRSNLPSIDFCVLATHWHVKSLLGANNE